MTVATELYPNHIKRTINPNYDANQLDNKELDPRFEGVLARGIFFMDEVRPYRTVTGALIDAETRKVGIYEKTEAGEMVFRDMVVPDTTLDTLVNKRLARMDEEKLSYVNCQCGNISAAGLAFVQDSALLTSYVDDNTSYTEFESALGSSAGLRSPNFTILRLNHAPGLGCVMRTGPSAASMRTWVGMFDAAPMSDDGPSNYVGFRNIAGVTAGWEAVARVGGGTVTSVPFTLGYTADSFWKQYMKYDKPTGRMDFYLSNGTLLEKVSIAAGLPSVSTNLGWAWRVDSTNALVGQRSRLSRLFIHQR